MTATDLAEPVAQPTRAERKRLETRGRIVAATEALIRSRPLDELTIAEITDTADVGHGTFYLHFSSKHEVIVPIIHQHTAQWDQAAQAAVRDVEDSAEVVAYSARQIGRLIVADPLYRWFLQHSGVPVEDVRQALGRFVARDIDKGITSGRFELPQTEAAMSFLFGGIVTAMMATFEVEDSASAIDDLAEMLLRGLGLAVAEAREIAHRPLGELDLEKTQ